METQKPSTGQGRLCLLTVSSYLSSWLCSVWSSFCRLSWPQGLVIFWPCPSGCWDYRCVPPHRSAKAVLIINQWTEWYKHHIFDFKINCRGHGSKNSTVLVQEQVHRPMEQNGGPRNKSKLPQPRILNKALKANFGEKLFKQEALGKLDSLRYRLFTILHCLPNIKNQLQIDERPQCKPRTVKAQREAPQAFQRGHSWTGLWQHGKQKNWKIRL